MSDELIFMELVKDLTFSQFLDLCVMIYSKGYLDIYHGYTNEEDLKKRLKSFVKEWLEM